MSAAKIAITLEESLVHKIDSLVKSKVFPNRSKAIQEAVQEKISRLEKTRLARECLNLDKVSEQNFADEGLGADFSEWPEY